MVDELSFRAMGSEAHVIVVDGPAGLDAVARQRVEELEQRWSRFLPDSEVSRLTAGAGDWLEVSDDTVELVEVALEAWRLTGASFDPTVLGAVLRAGYVRSFDELAERGPDLAPSDLVLGCTDIEIDGNRVRLPRGTGFDAGGIGKGLAADKVAEELLAAGAAGVCINLGGDLRAVGTSPDGQGWTIGIEHPADDRLLARVGLLTGAVATSTVARRRWQVGREERHHLIDPATGEPTTSDVVMATVIAPEAWQAEVLAKAALLRGADRAFDLLAAGIEALAVTVDGRVLATDGLVAFLGSEAIPPHIGEAA